MVLNCCADIAESGGEKMFTCRMRAADGSYVLLQTHISALMQAGRVVELCGFMFVLNQAQAHQI